MILTYLSLEIWRRSSGSLKFLFGLSWASANVLFAGRHRVSCMDFDISWVLVFSICLHQKFTNRARSRPFIFLCTNWRVRSKQIPSIDLFWCSDLGISSFITPPSNDPTETLPRRGSMMTRQENLLPRLIWLSKYSPPSFGCFHRWKYYYSSFR